MKETATWVDITAITSTALGVLVVFIITAVLTDIRLPFIATDRVAFFYVFVLGLTMCAIAGIGRTQATLGWLHPITIIGIVLGMLALVLTTAVFTGRTDFLRSAAGLVGVTTSAIPAERIALIGLAAIIVTKWLLGFAKYALR